MEICTGCGGTGFDGNCPVCGGSGMVGQEAPELGFGNITGCYYSTLKGSTSTKSAAIESERIAKKKLPKPKPKPNPLYQIDLPKLEFESAPTGRLVTNKPSRRKKSVKTIPHVSQKAQKPKMKSSARKGESVRIPKTESRKDGAKTRVRGRDDPRPPSHHSVHMNIWAEGFGPRASDYVSEKKKGPAPQPRGVPKKGGGAAEKWVWSWSASGLPERVGDGTGVLESQRPGGRAGRKPRILRNRGIWLRTVRFPSVVRSLGRLRRVALAYFLFGVA